MTKLYSQKDYKSLIQDIGAIFENGKKQATETTKSKEIGGEEEEIAVAGSYLCPNTGIRGNLGVARQVPHSQRIESDYNSDYPGYTVSSISAEYKIAGFVPRVGYHHLNSRDLWTRRGTLGVDFAQIQHFVVSLDFGNSWYRYSAGGAFNAHFTDGALGLKGEF